MSLRAAIGRFNMHSPRLFLDAILPRPVFVAPDRAGRPGDFAEPGAATARLDRCPFCLGNESLAPPAVLRAPPAEPALPDGGPWRSRIVPNRFPIVADLPTGGPAPPDLARGTHDVLVESPRHVASVMAVDPAGWREAWQLCQGRLGQLAGDGGAAWATVFKNSGPAAGASLVHVHSQIVGLPLVPPVIAAELAACAGPEDPFAAVLAAAVADDRLVAESPGLVALVPPAPRQPFEAWILPREPLAFLHASPTAVVAELADLTRWYVGRLERLAPGADYNWWLHQPPFARGPAAAPAPRFRWHLEIMPRINGLAGFELGTGCHASTLPPADCATQLRSG